MAYRIAAILLFVFLITGCLSVETRISLSDGEDGEVTFIYTVDRGLLEAEVFDREASVWPIPVSRRDFELFADTVEGARLTGYDRADGEEDAVVTATYRFDSRDALARLLGSRESLELEAGRGDTGVRLQLTPLGVAELSPEQRSFMESYLREATMTYQVSTPEPVVETNLGEATGREVRVVYTMSELLHRPEPLFLEVSW